MEPDYIRLLPGGRKAIFKQKSQLVTIPLHLNENSNNERCSHNFLNNRRTIQRYIAWIFALSILCVSVIYLLIYVLIATSNSTKCKNSTSYSDDSIYHSTESNILHDVDYTTYEYDFNEDSNEFNNETHKISKRYKRSPKAAADILQNIDDKNCQLNSESQYCLELFNQLEAIEKELNNISGAFQTIKNGTKFLNTDEKKIGCYNCSRAQNMDSINTINERTANSEDLINFKTETQNIENGDHDLFENLNRDEFIETTSFKSFPISDVIEIDTFSSEKSRKLVSIVPAESISIESDNEEEERNKDNESNFKQVPEIDSVSPGSERLETFENKNVDSTTGMSIIFVTESSSKISLQTDNNFTETPFSDVTFKASFKSNDDLNAGQDILNKRNDEEKGADNSPTISDETVAENNQFTAEIDEHMITPNSILIPDRNLIINTDKPDDLNIVDNSATNINNQKIFDYNGNVDDVQVIPPVAKQELNTHIPPLSENFENSNDNHMFSPPTSTERNQFDQSHDNAPQEWAPEHRTLPEDQMMLPLSEIDLPQSSLMGPETSISSTESHLQQHEFARIEQAPTEVSHIEELLQPNFPILREHTDSIQSQASDSFEDKVLLHNLNSTKLRAFEINVPPPTSTEESKTEFHILPKVNSTSNKSDSISLQSSESSKSLPSSTNMSTHSVEPPEFDYNDSHRHPSQEWLNEHGISSKNPEITDALDYNSNHYTSTKRSVIKHEFLPVDPALSQNYESDTHHLTPSQDWLKEHGLFSATPLPNDYHTNRNHEVSNQLSDNSESTARIVSNSDDRFLSPKPNNMENGNFHSAVTSESMKAATQTIHSSGSQVIPVCFYGISNANGQIQSPSGFSPFQSSKDTIARFEGITPRTNEFTMNSPKMNPYGYPGYPGQPYPYPPYPMLQPQPYPTVNMPPYPYFGSYPQNGESSSFIIPPGSHMPPQQQPYRCYNINAGQLPASYSPLMSDYRTASSISPTNYDEEVDYEGDAYNSDHHFSIHYKNAEVLVDKTYGNHSHPSSRSASSCKHGQKMCASTGHCLEESKWCDGMVDCEDGSDESKCPCRSRVDRSRICDGFYDCPMGEDEMGCFKCDRLSFSCNEWTGTASRPSCFTMRQRCDGVPNCKNKIDEHECNMLHSSLEHHAIVEISHSKGFLHRNYRGKWFPVCNNPYKWAMQACIMEIEEFKSSPLIQLVEKPQNFKGMFIQEAENGKKHFVNDCFNGSAVFVTCPHMKCGSTSQVFSQTLRQVSENEELYSRSKRQIHIDPVIQIGAFAEDENHNPYISYVNTIYGHNEMYGKVMPTYEESVPKPYDNNQHPYMTNTIEHPEPQNNYINPYIMKPSSYENEYDPSLQHHENTDEDKNSLYVDNLHNSFPPHIDTQYNNDPKYFGNISPQKTEKRNTDDSYYYYENLQPQYEEQISGYENGPLRMNNNEHENIYYDEMGGENHFNGETNEFQEHSYRNSKESMWQSEHDIDYNDYGINAPEGVKYSVSLSKDDHDEEDFRNHQNGEIKNSEDREDLNSEYEDIKTDENHNIRNELNTFTEDILRRDNTNQPKDDDDLVDSPKADMGKNNFSTAARDKKGELRVVGGKMSSPAAWPWVVAINKDGIFTCGGTLISNLWVLTAAHCTGGYWVHFYEIQVGILRRLSYSPQEQRIPVSVVIAHHKFNRNTMYNDIALMKLQRPVVINRWVRPACLPSEESAGAHWLWGPLPGTMCTAVGWGSMEERGPDPDHLHEVDVPVMAHCKTKLDEEGLEICAGFAEGGHDACQGDSGGPFLCKNPHNKKQWYVAGIVGHGEGCARANEPGVYTRVSLYINWIKENTEGETFPARKPKQKCPGFSCKWGTQRCLPKNRRCDTIVDCLAGEDEIGCEESYKNMRASDVSEFDTSLEADDKYFDEEALFNKHRNMDDHLVGAMLDVPRNDFDEIYYKPKEQSARFRSEINTNENSTLDTEPMKLNQTELKNTNRFEANITSNATILDEAKSIQNNISSTTINPELIINETRDIFFESSSSSVLTTTEHVTQIPEDEGLPLIVQPDNLIEMDKQNDTLPEKDIENDIEHTTDRSGRSIDNSTASPFTLNATTEMSESLKDKSLEQTTINPIIPVIEILTTTSTISPQIDSKSFDSTNHDSSSTTIDTIIHTVDESSTREPTTPISKDIEITSQPFAVVNHFTTSPVIDNHEKIHLDSTTNMIDSTIDEEKFLPLNILPSDTSNEKHDDDLDPNISGDHSIESHVDKKELDIDETKKEPLDRDMILLASEEAKKINDFIKSIRFPQDQPNFPLHEKFRCKRLTQAVPIWKKCNRFSDCEDGSDEWDCSCSDYLVYNHPHLLCDGYVDCADGQDEKNCSSCSPHQMQCRISKHCIPLEKVCDRTRDCEFGEDELDCFTLFNDGQINIDIDTRPHQNQDGILAVMQKGSWETVCEHNWPTEKKESTAKHICNYLGFNGFDFYDEVELIKDGTVKFGQMTVPHVFPVFRNANKNRTVKQKETVEQKNLRQNFTLKASSRSIKPSIKMDKCIGLYVKCLQSVATNVSTHFLPNKIFTDVIQQNVMANEVQDLYLWPWVGKLYSDGVYKCSGVLIDYVWMIVENACLMELNIYNKYITVVVGSKRSIPDIDGPYEQIIKIDGEKQFSFTPFGLLHLQTPAYHSRYVRPVPIPDFDMSAIHEDNVCLIAAIDDHGGSVSIFLEPVTGDCGLSNRCFRRTHFPEYCNSLDQRHESLNLAAWSGIVVCHRHSGWYPAATYSDPEGACGFREHITGLPDIAHRKYDIYTAIESQVLNKLPEVRCAGARCQLGQCVSPLKVCDGIAECRDGYDEGHEHCNLKQNFCTNSPFHPDCGCAASQIKCGNGKCLPKSLFANRVNDCGDHSDEPSNPNCLAYLQLSDPIKICDGITHCKDMSDENPHYCKCFARNTYKCEDTDLCIPYDAVCDGFNHCPNGDDEQTCTALNSDNNFGVGEVMEQNHGIWHTKCFVKNNFTKIELEDICRQMQYTSGHAAIMTRSHEQFYERPITKVVLDSFTDVVFKRTSFSMRNGNSPYATEIPLEDNIICHRLYIECI